MSSFSYKIIAGNVNLSWITESELNNKGFEIERTFENNNWEVIGFTDGHGTTVNRNIYSFIDKDVSLNTNYSYRLKQIDFDGTYNYSDIIAVSYHTISSYSLSQNFPNPFNPTTKINFNIPQSGNVKLTIHNIIGETISILVNKKMEEGTHSVEFNASSLPSGIYIYQIEVNNFLSTKKMILVK